MTARRSVLVVDASEETQTVLRTALERRGWQILSATRGDQGLLLAQSKRPDLIVLDLEIQAEQDGALEQGFRAQAAQHDTPLVMLGSVRRAGHVPPGRFVPKPYHYAPLIRTIESLLETAVAPAVAAPQ